MQCLVVLAQERGSDTAERLKSFEVKIVCSLHLLPVIEISENTVLGQAPEFSLWTFMPDWLIPPDATHRRTPFRSPARPQRQFRAAYGLERSHLVPRAKQINSAAGLALVAVTISLDAEAASLPVDAVREKPETFRRYAHVADRLCG